MRTCRFLVILAFSRQISGCLRALHFLSEALWKWRMSWCCGHESLHTPRSTRTHCSANTLTHRQVHNTPQNTLPCCLKYDYSLRPLLFTEQTLWTMCVCCVCSSVAKRESPSDALHKSLGSFIKRDLLNNFDIWFVLSLWFVTRSTPLPSCYI